MPHTLFTWQACPVSRPAIPLDTVVEYERLRAMGVNRSEACRRVGVSAAWGSKHDVGRTYKQVLPPARLSADFDPDVLEDFGLFRETYLSHVRKPWMDEAAATVWRLIHTPDPEFMVINCPPGAGKSSFLQDLVTWLIVKDRRNRCLYGADTRANATRATRLIQSYLEAVEPPFARPELVGRGEAVQSVRTLAADFGAFKPDSERGGLWRQDEFRVEFNDGGSQAVKEPTLLALGKDSGVMGNRFEACCWDDLVTEDVTRSAAQNEKLREEWDGGLGESRVEPGDSGLMFLVGQRIGPQDLYRYNLDKNVTEWIDGREVDRKMYTHICFPAHFDELCVDAHGKDQARAWPMGCLLDPARLPWYGSKGLKAKKENSPRAYAVQYQQQDGNSDDALIQHAYVWGGKDSEGVERPGCLNRSRVLGQLPHGWDSHQLVSVVTVDPSPTQYWAVQWWVMNHTINARALMGLIDRKMTSNQVLNMHLNPGGSPTFSGVLEDLYWTAKQAHLGFSHVIFEINAAQRWFTTSAEGREWKKARGVVVQDHTTSRNKNDPALGLASLVEPYASGAVDLPYGDLSSRIATETLARQLTQTFDRDDQKMANWFMELFFHRLKAPKSLPLLPRPSWQRRPARV